MIHATPIPNLCLGPIEITAPGETVDCGHCGRSCTARDLRLCRAKGPSQPSTLNPQPSTTRHPPCPHLGAVIAHEPCTCGSRRLVDVHACGHPDAGLRSRCVPHSGEANQLSDKDTRRHVRTCDDCPLRPERSAVSPGEAQGLGPREQGQNTTRPAPLALLSPLVSPVRHVIGHLYPVSTNAMWRWNLDQLRARIEQFHGRRLLSVALDESTVSSTEVVAACAGLGLEVSFVANDPSRGEGVSFLSLLDQLGPALHDPQSVIYYWHGKGTSKGDTGRLKEWATAMWLLLFDAPAQVDAALRDKHVVGSFRQPWPRGPSWHYSGTFFAFRGASLVGRDWRRLGGDRFGVERWPGELFTSHESACLFGDQVPLIGSQHSLYEESAWVKLRPQLAARSRSLNSQPSAMNHQPSTSTSSAAIIITCGPRYDRWVGDAVKSAVEQEGSPEIIVVFDRCQPCPLPPGVRSLSVDFGAVQKARQSGIAATKGEVLFFLDADNAYQGTRFVRDACEQLRAASQADPRIAGVSVDIDYFDDQWRKHPHAIPLRTPHWDRGRFERENFLDTCTPVWRHALEASWKQTVANGSHEDHHMWRQLVRDGWTVGKGNGLTLRYRFCPDSSSSRKGQGNYAQRYDLHHQPLTIFVPLSGRAWAWPDLRDWLARLAQTGRGKSVRLVLCDTSGDASFGCHIYRDAYHMGFSDVRYYRQSVAAPGLADLDRATHERAVQLACAAIYNRFAQECTTHLALILEDDILPQLSGEETLRNLIDGFGPKVAAVSGVYHDRRHGGVNSWKSSTAGKVQHVTHAEMDAAPSDYLPINGTGFGCLMIRREVLQSVPHALPPGELWYDPRFFNAVARSGLGCVLARNVTCEHRNSPVA